MSRAWESIRRIWGWGRAGRRRGRPEGEAGSEVLGEEWGVPKRRAAVCPLRSFAHGNFFQSSVYRVKHLLSITTCLFPLGIGHPCLSFQTTQCTCVSKYVVHFKSQWSPKLRERPCPLGHQACGSTTLRVSASSSERGWLKHFGIFNSGFFGNRVRQTGS